MQAQLFAIRAGALQEQAQLYAEGSKERADLDLEIDALYKEAQMEREKLYLAAVSKLRNEYDKKSAAERFKLEKATFDALLDAKQISEEEYRKFLKALREKYNKEDDTERSEASDSTDEVEESYDKRLKILQSKLAHELLTHEEFLKKKQKLDKEYLLKGLDALKKNGGEWNTMFVDIYTSFAKLVKGLGGDTGATLDNIAKATAAVSSAVVAGMQIATEFAKAEAEIQTAAVEKRYKREIELAQGNSYKTTLLEKQKEKELAKIKNDASKKQFAMQVIQAVAQTATNAISAYGAALMTGPQGLILAPIAAAIAVAQGALQVALLKKQQQASEAQGYSKGGFTKPGGINEPAGIVHAGEWVASQKLLASPVARPLIDALDYAQRTNTIGTLRAADVSRSIRATDSLVRIAETDTQAALMVATVAQNAKALSQLTSRLSEPFVTVATVTGDHGIRRAQDDYARMLNNVTPKSKRR